MQKISKKILPWNFEIKFFLALTVAFVSILVATWIYALKISDTVAEQNPVLKLDVQAPIELEKLKKLSQSQYFNSLTYFLMGSTTLLDDVEKDKHAFSTALLNFERNYKLAQVPEIVKQITKLQQQRQDFFDQAMEFRSKQTESKIVGQFFRSKVSPLEEQTEKALDEIVKLHNAEFAQAKANAEAAAETAQNQIPFGITWLTLLLVVLFAGLSFLIFKMFREALHQIDDRDRLYQEAKKSVQTRDEVIAVVSQDLNEPLKEIQEVAAQLAKAQTEDEVKEGSDLIKSLTKEAEDRIQDLLDQNRTDNGSLIVRLDQQGLDSVFEDARTLLQPIAKQKDIRLEFNSTNPPALAFLDHERVLRILSHLVSNSIKFSERNSKVVVKARSDQQYVYVSVKDEGPGIPSKFLPQIFDNFWQARKTATQGAGLGLAIVKTLVEAQGGQITVESTMGNGSTFTFTLPKRRPASANMKKRLVQHGRLVTPNRPDFQEGPNV